MRLEFVSTHTAIILGQHADHVTAFKQLLGYDFGWAPPHFRLDKVPLFDKPCSQLRVISLPSARVALILVSPTRVTTAGKQWAGWVSFQRPTRLAQCIEHRAGPISVGAVAFSGRDWPGPLCPAVADYRNQTEPIYQLLAQGLKAAAYRFV